MLRTNRLIYLILVLVAASTSRAADNDHERIHRVQLALKQGIDWLLHQQAADGCWHSATYGQMRGGIGNTALVAYTLAHLPQPLRDEVQPQFRRALEFLLTSPDPRGFPQTAEKSVDYPTYATALLLLALERRPAENWLAERRKMREFLAAAQFPATSSGEGSGDDAGGWSVSGNLGSGEPSEHANVSATAFALEALTATGNVDKRAKGNALQFLSRCQNLNHPPADGGFYFTPLADDPLNKAGLPIRRSQLSAPRSYGTATADGLIALKASGVAPDDPRAKRALAWLTEHASLDRVPGFPGDKTEANIPPDALKLYYYFSLARAARHFPDSPISKQLPQIADAVLQMQKPTGAWINPSPAMREDDPLIATPFALFALATYLESRTEARR